MFRRKTIVIANMFVFDAAPSVHETLKQDDAARVLEAVLEAQNQSVSLGLKLKLPLHVVEAIHSMYQHPKDRLLHVVIEFLRQDEPCPTWRVIVDALKSPIVHLPRLANRIEAAHIPKQGAPPSGN